jgi:hypothetical protein
MKFTELLQRKSECIRLAQSGFTFEEASDVNQLIIEQFQARIDELEAEVVQYKEDLDLVLEALEKAVTRLNEWNHNLAQDFVTLLLMDLQKKEET